MKKLKCILYVVMLSLVLVGCRKPAEISFSKSDLEIEPQGGTTEVSLISNGDWKVDSTPDWMTVSPMSGNGDATLTLTIAPNSGTELRIGTVTASTKDNSTTLSVTQSFIIIPYLTISPNAIEFDHLGGDFEIVVSSNSDWQLETLPDWISASVFSGSNDGSISVTVAPIDNDIEEGREATIIISSESLSASMQVRQTAAPAVDYIFSVAPMNLNFEHVGGTVTLSVTSTIEWSVTTEADWITFTPSSGDSNAEVTVDVTANEEQEERESSILFSYIYPNGSTGGIYVWVRQEAAPDPHFLTVTPLQINMPQEGGQVEVAVACDTDWEVDQASDWISISPDHGTGNGSFTLTIDANEEVMERSTGIPVLSGELKEIIYIHQEGMEIVPEINFSTDTLYVSPEGEVQTLYITSNIPWNLSASSWITLTTVNGNGDGYTGIIVEKNPTSTDRIGIIRASYNEQILNQVVVYQPGRVPYLETNTTQISATSEGGTFTVEVSSNQAWLVSKGAYWLQYTPTNGIGNGHFEIHIDSQENPRPRTAEIYVSGVESGEIIRINIEQSMQ